MHVDRSRQRTFRQKNPSFNSVASEASIHRQKIASLRSTFLNQPCSASNDTPPFIGSLTLPTTFVRSRRDDEVLPFNANASNRNLHNCSALDPSSSNVDVVPSLQSRLPICTYTQLPTTTTISNVDSHLPLIRSQLSTSKGNTLATAKSPINTQVRSRTSLYPRRTKQIILTSSNALGGVLSQQQESSNLVNSKMPSAVVPSWRNESFYTPNQTLAANVCRPSAGSRSLDPRTVQEKLDAVATYPQPSFHKSMYYHQNVVEPVERYRSAITLSPSEPLCLHTARQIDFCRSCQKLTNSRASSYHRSSSRHSSIKASASQMEKESGEDSFAERGRKQNKLHNSLPIGYRSVNDLKRYSRRRVLSSSSSSSSSNLCDNSYAPLSSDEFWPIAVKKPKDRACRRRRTRSLNPRWPPGATDSSTDDDEDARAVGALAMRLQPMLAEGRISEVQTILLRALTRPEMRQRALSLLDYLSGDGSLLALPTTSQQLSSTKSDTSLNEVLTCTSEVSSDLSQTFASRLKLAHAVENNESGEDDDEEKSSGIFGNPAVSNASLLHDAKATTAPNASVVQVMLPPGGLVEPPPPRLAMPPPKPLPPPTPKSAVVPSPETLARVDAHALEMLAVNPLLITDLVSQLTVDCSSDVEIVRRLFRWVTAKNFDLVEYDPSAPSDSFVGMLRNVQIGALSRNELFNELCRFAGIYCQYISGYSKGAGYRPGMPLKQGSLFRNTWLAVYAGGGWRFVNCNWAARYTTSTWNSPSNDCTESDYKCDEFYFFTDPEQHIFEHWPDNKVWQLLHAKPISQARFISLPVLKSAFFNAGLSLKKPYSQRLVTKNGQVSIKLRMPYFVGISCSLENFADGSSLKGFCLVEVLIKPQDVVRIYCAPSQPGRYYLNVYVSSDWRRDDTRELACSFQVQCCDFNYPRLVVMGRLPQVGFLGRTPAAQHFGVAMVGSSGSGNRPYILHTSSDPLKIPFVIPPGLRVCHQLKSFDRPGRQMSDCDNYALLQMRFASSSDGAYTGVSTSTSTNVNLGASAANAHYHLRLPVNAFFYLTVYAAYEDVGTISTEANDHLECVYRVLVDARRPTLSNGSGPVPAFPRQTYWWVGSRLLEPTRLALEVKKRHLFRLDVPTKYTSVAVVINASEWHFLKSSSSSTGCSRWSGKVLPLSAGELSVYASTIDASSNASERVPYVKLLEYVLIQPLPPSPPPPAC
uniref:Protein KRI1 homolog n=1 Tax=Mesocestoides corti TaxID=53468 RepID=A0A5K3EK17_MESCO